MPAAPNAPFRVGPTNQTASLTGDADEEEEEEDEPEEQPAGAPAQAQQTSALFPLANPFRSSSGQSNCLLGGCGHCDRCKECGPPRGFYARGEVIYWWVQGMSVPPLVTTSPPGTAQAAAGVLPGATVLFGNGAVNGQGRVGGRVTFGYWFDQCETMGIESTTFGLQPTNTSFNSTVSDGTPILARPIFNVNTNAQDAALVAYPNLLNGQITSQVSTKIFGTEVNLRKALFGGGSRRFDGLIGYRFARFDEGLETSSLSVVTGAGGGVPLNTTFNIHDTFGTQNMFNGINFGGRWMYDRGGRFSFDVLGKAAIGAMTERVSINGATTTTEPGMSPVTQVCGHPGSKSQRLLPDYRRPSPERRLLADVHDQRGASGQSDRHSHRYESISAAAARDDALSDLQLHRHQRLAARRQLGSRRPVLIVREIGYCIAPGNATPRA
jgi:hypothetical protein